MVKIVSLVENRSTCGCKTAHALSLYIETPRHKILFDVGSDQTIFANAAQLGVDLAQVDTIIISHGHRDHAGALSMVLDKIPSATVYMQRGAFNPHFSQRATGLRDIGLDTDLMRHERVVLLDGEFDIDTELKLIKVTDNSLCRSSANLSLYEGDAPDNFDHEQNLIICGEQSVLVMGCGHNGVVNIMLRAAEFSPRHCIGGFHLTSPSANRDEPKELIDSVIDNLASYPTVQFHTCHCTGERVYDYMHSRMSNISYLSCGDSFVVE